MGLFAVSMFNIQMSDSSLLKKSFVIIKILCCCECVIVLLGSWALPEIQWVSVSWHQKDTAREHMAGRCPLSRARKISYNNYFIPLLWNEGMGECCLRKSASIILTSGGVLAIHGLHVFSPRLKLSWGSLQRCPGATLLFPLVWVFQSGFRSLATDLVWYRWCLVK